jgi:acetyl esterase
MPLDPYAKRLLGMLRSGQPQAAGEITAPMLRQASVQLARMLDAKDVSIAKTEDRLVPQPTHAIPIRVYTPLAAEEGGSGGIVYFHGGTGIFGSIDTHDGLCRLLANASACRIISVGYRLAPEHPFPAAIEDSYAATCWVAEAASELGIDPKRIAIAGDSAGGTLATVVCQLARGGGGPRLRLQVLFCPVTDVSTESPSRKKFADGYFLDRTTLQWALEHYCPAIDLRDPRLSPLHAEDLAGLPPAHIHTAEYDPLLDEGKAFADRLAAAAVPVNYVCHAGMIHHFYAMAGFIPYARQAIQAAGIAIKEALA